MRGSLLPHCVRRRNYVAFGECSSLHTLQGSVLAWPREHSTVFSERRSGMRTSKDGYASDVTELCHRR